MTLYTHNRQKPRQTSEASTKGEAHAQAEHGASASPSRSAQNEEAARSVMHPDHHDPDWRYYFGAMAG